jgi:hypothetical protein
MVMRRRGPGLIGTAARTAVIAGTATAVSGSVMRRQQRRAYEEQQRYEAQYPQQPQYAPQPQYAEPAAPPAEPDYVAELEQLSQLKSRGLITEEEFQAKKKQLLGI